MVRYLYSARARSCPLIRSAQSEVTVHERTDPPFYYLDPFYGARRLKEVSHFATISRFLLPSPRSASSAALNASSLRGAADTTDNIKRLSGLTVESCWVLVAVLIPLNKRDAAKTSLPSLPGLLSVRETL